ARADRAAGRITRALRRMRAHLHLIEFCDQAHARPDPMTPVHQIWFLDLLDIFLVAALFYRLLILVKGTRSAQMYVGLLIIVLVGIVAREFELIAVKWIVDSLKTVWLIAFVILFQPELRHALAQFGRT